MRNQYISFEQNNDIKGFLSYANKLLSEEKERMSNINAVNNAFFEMSLTRNLAEVEKKSDLVDLVKNKSVKDFRCCIPPVDKNEEYIIISNSYTNIII